MYLQNLITQGGKTLLQEKNFSNAAVVTAKPMIDRLDRTVA